MSRATPTSRFSVQLTHESTLGFLHLVVARCLLQNKEEVSGFYAHCYTRIRTFKLPADMIIRYDHFEVSGEAVREFAIQRSEWAARLGGGLYRYAEADESRRKLSVSSLPSPPGQTAFAIFETFDAAVRQLLADREKTRRPTYATLQRQMGDPRTRLAPPRALTTPSGPILLRPGLPDATSKSSGQG